MVSRKLIKIISFLITIIVIALGLTLGWWFMSVTSNTYPNKDQKELKKVQINEDSYGTIGQPIKSTTVELKQENGYGRSNPFVPFKAPPAPPTPTTPSGQPPAATPAT